MAPQIKMFANGVKSVLTSKGNGRSLLQVFDRENCMIAQREIQSKKGLFPGSKTIEKLTLRKNKESEGMIEYLSSTTGQNGSCASSRVVCREFGDELFCNNNMHNDIYYFQESTYGQNNALKRLDFPLLKKTNQTKTKYDELRETMDNMWKQWFNPKSKGQVKPMMPKSLEKQITSMATE